MARSASALVAVLILSGFAANQQVATHTVVGGDTLWDLAERYYDDPFTWRRIWEANRSTIADPNLILPGQVFTIPGRAGEPTAAVTAVGVDSPEERQDPAATPRLVPGGRTILYQDPSLIRAGARTGEVAYLPVPRDQVHSAPWLVALGSEPEHVGVLVGFAGGVSESTTPRTYDRVRLTFSGSPPAAGTLLQTYRIQKTIDNVGEVVVPTGVVTVSETDAEGGIGLVAKEFDRIALGDFLGPLPSYGLVPGQYPETVSGGSEAMVMGFAGHGVLQDLGVVAFLDLGSENGVVLGDEFDLFNPEAGLDVIEGRLQVVGVRAGTSSARITHMDDTVFRQGVVVRLTRKMR